MTGPTVLSDSFTFPTTFLTVSRMSYGAMQLAGRNGTKLVCGLPKTSMERSPFYAKWSRAACIRSSRRLGIPIPKISSSSRKSAHGVVRTGPGLLRIPVKNSSARFTIIAANGKFGVFVHNVLGMSSSHPLA